MCAASTRKYHIEVVAIYKFLNLCLTGYFLLSDLSFILLPSKLWTSHGYTALSVNTAKQRTRELLQLLMKTSGAHLHGLLYDEGRSTFPAEGIGLFCLCLFMITQSNLTLHITLSHFKVKYKGAPLHMVRLDKQS